MPLWQRRCLANSGSAEAPAASIVSRAVARVCCAARFDDAALGKSFDLASKPGGEGTPTLHAASVFEALAGKTCDYATVLDDPPSIPALRG